MNFEKQVFMKLAEPLLEGFSWGWGAKNADGPYEKEDLESFSKENITASMMEGLSKLNAAEVDLDFVNKVDVFVDQHEQLEDLREFLIDLAILQVIQEGPEEEGEDFFDSEDWQAIEKLSSDRGTEMLNLLIYLRDCMETDVQPSLEDFLTEFLLVEEDGYQDEFFIYETMIKNQEMTDGDVGETVAFGNEQKGEMQELFTPTMVFFTKREKRPGRMMQSILEGSKLGHVHAALYWLLCKAQANLS